MIILARNPMPSPERLIKVFSLDFIKPLKDDLEKLSTEKGIVWYFVASTKTKGKLT
jgi:hypothetical protein